MIKKID